MHKVLVSDSLSEQGLAVLRQSPGLEVDYRPGLNEADLAAAVVGADALVIRSGSRVTAKVLAHADRLKVIGRAGIGVDNVDVVAASKRGIVVMNTPTGNAVTTAEHAITLLMSLARMIPEACRTLKAGKWEKKKFEGRELAGKTLAVIGLGNIGRIVADRAHGLKMNVIGYDPIMTADRAAALGIELCSLDAIWPRADAVSVHTPLTAETRGLVNAGMLSRLKKGVLLVNAARGGIYDEAALLQGLESGQIGGVALDVFVEEPPPKDHPLVAHERVIVTPHLGASTREAQDRVALEIAEQVAAYLLTGAIKNAVNVPSVSGEIASKLAPYAELADRLGRFLAQVETQTSPQAIEVECVGEPAELGPKTVTSSAVAGFLGRWQEQPVNQVSARHVAADRGIAVRELHTVAPTSKYAALVIVRIQGADGGVHAVEGTIGSDGSARLVKWGEFEIEAHLGGPTMVVTSVDTPGVIGFIGTTLGNARINVARVNMGLAGGARRLGVEPGPAPPRRRPRRGAPLAQRRERARRPGLAEAARGADHRPRPRRRGEHPRRRDRRPHPREPRAEAGPRRRLPGPARHRPDGRPGPDGVVHPPLRPRPPHGPRRRGGHPLGHLLRRRRGAPPPLRRPPHPLAAPPRPRPLQPRRPGDLAHPRRPVRPRRLQGVRCRGPPPHRRPPPAAALRPTDLTPQPPSPSPDRPDA